MSELTNELSAEQIDANWQRYRLLCSKLKDRSEAALTMIDSLGERLIFCPASSKAHFHLAIPGGLVDHSLRVFLNARTLVKAYNWEIPLDSLIIGCLFHDLGKVGNHEESHYLVQTDSYWRDKRGENYVINNSIPFMEVPLRGIWLCQHYGLKLTHDECLAIYLNDGYILDQNKPYCLKEGALAHLVMTADYLSTCQEKGTLPK